MVKLNNIKTGEILCKNLVLLEVWVQKWGVKMFEDISFINAVYQLISIAVLIGIVFLVVSFVRSSRENKKS